MNNFTAIAFGLLLLSGCSSTAGIAVRTTGSTPQADTPNIKQVNSSRLKGKAVITSTKKFQDGNMMSAQVGLRSRVAKTINLQYRFIWFTACGRQLDAGDAWMPCSLIGRLVNWRVARLINQVPARNERLM